MSNRVEVWLRCLMLMAGVVVLIAEIADGSLVWAALWAVAVAWIAWNLTRRMLPSRSND